MTASMQGSSGILGAVTVKVDSEHPIIVSVSCESPGKAFAATGVSEVGTAVAVDTAEAVGAGW